MYSNVLDRILKKLWPKVYSGAYPIDIIPKKSSLRKNVYIVNSDDSTQPGRHWYLVFVDHNKTFFFDSFGKEPCSQMLLFIKSVSYTSKIVYNSKQIQSLDSKTCGFFCIFLTFWLKCDLTFASFIDLFGSNFLANDLAVCALAKKVFPEIKKVKCF